MTEEKATCIWMAISPPLEWPFVMMVSMLDSLGSVEVHQLGG